MIVVCIESLANVVIRHTTLLLRVASTFIGPRGHDFRGDQLR